MSQTAIVRCRCGEVQGSVTNVSPKAVNRVTCYCDDCQAFLHHLGRADLLDAHGGTDIVQVAPASVTYHGATARIVGLRLTAKGLYRFYADCCKTPLGNTAGPAIPFVGIVAQAFERVEDVVGPSRGGIMGKFGVGQVPPQAKRIDVLLLAHVVRMLLGWKLTGKGWPHPFFDRQTRHPTRPLMTLSNAERETLRPFCGPHPTSRAAM